MMEVLSGDKPIDLHSAVLTRDHRVYECASCGDRYSDKEVGALGGLCPKDGVVFRSLGRFETKHAEFRKSWMRFHKAA